MSADDEDDLMLWDQIKKSVKPLRNTPAKTVALKTKVPQRSGVPKIKTASTPVLTPAPRAPALPPLASLDRRAKSRIARGSMEIEARLDLHGHKLMQARDRLRQFLENAQARGKSVVLVITGKGRTAPEGAERGVLKREVPLWLSSPEFRALVIGFEEAAPSHGGSGALYVRVRRRRS